MHLGEALHGSHGLHGAAVNGRLADDVKQSRDTRLATTFNELLEWHESDANQMVRLLDLQLSFTVASRLMEYFELQLTILYEAPVGFIERHCVHM